jgi:hypothetical protein
MGPRLTTPVNPPRVSICACVASVCTPVQKPLTPPLCISVGVSPIRIHRTPTQTFASKASSPVPLEKLLPPNLAAFFSEIDVETQTTQPACQCPPIRSASPISLTESDSEADAPLLRSRIRLCSPEIIPETQVESDKDLPVRPCLLISRIYLMIHLLIQCLQRFLKPESASESKHRKIHKS